jgi:hypothetical protein
MDLGGVQSRTAIFEFGQRSGSTESLTSVFLGK